MVIKVSPGKLDGTLCFPSGKTEDAVYYLTSNVFGNRVKTEIPGEFQKKAAEIKSLLLSFNAKGTNFDLSEKSELLPAIAFCACYAFSDTRITVSDDDFAFAVCGAINSVGGRAEISDGVLTVKGNAGITGGKVDAGECVSVAKAALFAASCAENPVTVEYNGGEIDQEFIKTFSSLGGKIEVVRH